MTTDPRIYEAAEKTLMEPRLSWSIRDAIDAALSCAHRLSGEGAPSLDDTIDDYAGDTYALTRDTAASIAKLREACGGSKPSGGHNIVDEVCGLLRVTRGQRDSAEADLAAARERAERAEVLALGWLRSFQAVAEAMGLGVHAAPATNEHVTKRAAYLSSMFTGDRYTAVEKAEGDLAAARAEVMAAKERIRWLTDEESEPKPVKVRVPVYEDLKQQLAAAQATIAGQGEQINGHVATIKMLSGTREAVAVERDRAEQALTSVGWVRCDGEAGWKPPIGRKPLSLSVDRYELTIGIHNRQHYPDPTRTDGGEWIRYADLLAWERGEPTAPDTTKAYGELITELIAAKDIIRRIASLGIALTVDDFTPDVRPKYRKIIRELATEAGVKIGIGEGQPPNLDQPTAPESAGKAGPTPRLAAFAILERELPYNQSSAIADAIGAAIVAMERRP